jgi:hypothetical protein
MIATKTKECRPPLPQVVAPIPSSRYTYCSRFRIPLAQLLQNQQLPDLVAHSVSYRYASMFDCADVERRKRWNRLQRRIMACFVKSDQDCQVVTYTDRHVQPAEHYIHYMFRRLTT